MSTEREHRVVTSQQAATPSEPSAPTDALSSVPSTAELNRTFLTKVRAELDAKIRKEHLDNLNVTAVNEQDVEFTVSSVFVRDWWIRNHLPELRRAVLSIAGGARSVRIVVNSQRDGDSKRRAAVDATLQHVVPEEAPPLTSYEAEERRRTGRTTPQVEAVPASVADSPRVAGLNGGYSFETFVVGPCNRLAHAAALAIGESPGRAYNPFFIHGSVGLGKTHLLQAICHAVLRRHPGKKVAYLSCEEFTNQFINSVQGAKLDAFREYYRSVDVLVVDDVQFLANKDRTQDEFFHTFNALYNSHRQVVMSSDCAPFEIPTLEERLVSRFKWGLVTQLESPCYETRHAIVQRKARLRGAELPDDVVRFIAETVDTNIRELEGAVVKLIGVAALTAREISIELAHEALHGVARPRTRRVTLDNVMTIVAREFSLSPRDIVGKSRVSHISLTRQVGMFLARQYTDHSLEEIGRFFGNRDHTTVIYGLSKIKKRAQQDRSFQALLERLGSRLVSTST
jgi:chromosomal replication initiator protein